MIRASVVQAFRRVATPLIWYYAVTLALPLANGAGQAGALFVEHALVVLVFPLGLVVIVGLIRGVVFGHRRRSVMTIESTEPAGSHREPSATETPRH